MLYTFDEYKDRAYSGDNLIYDGKDNRLVQTRFGYFLYNRHDKYVGRAMGYYGEYSIDEAQVMNMLCQPGDVAMDIGANMGALTLPLSYIVGDEGYVYAFEPQRLVFQILCSNIAINSIKNVECLPYAVTEDDGEREVPEVVLDKDQNLGSFSLKDELDFTAKTHKIFTVTLDTYFENLKQLNFIKMDIEGMEVNALRGGRDLINRFRPAMYIENDRSEASKWLIEELKALKYKMFWHCPMMYSPDNFNKNKHNIYGKTMSQNMICLPEEANVDFDSEVFQSVKDGEWHPEIKH